MASRFPGKPIQTFVTTPLASSTAASASAVDVDPLGQLLTAEVRPRSAAPPSTAATSSSISTAVTSAAALPAPVVQPASAFHLRAPSMSNSTAADLWGSDPADDNDLLSSTAAAPMNSNSPLFPEVPKARPAVPSAPAPTLQPVAVPVSAVDELKEFFSPSVPPASSHARLSASSVSQDESGVRMLAAAGRWNACVELVDHLLKAPKLESMLGSLASLGGAVHALLPDAMLRVRFWLIVALCRLKRFDRAERELQSLGDLDCSDPQVPFELLLLRAEFSSIRGETSGSIQALQELLVTVSAQLSLSVSQHASTCPASPAITTAMRQLHCVILRLVHLHCGPTVFTSITGIAKPTSSHDPVAAVSLLQQLFKEYVRLAQRVGAHWIPSPILLALMSRIFLQIGDTETASTLLDEAELHSIAASAVPVGYAVAITSTDDCKSNIECPALWTAPLPSIDDTLNRALLLMAQHSFDEAFAMLDSVMNGDHSPCARVELVNAFSVASLFSNKAALAVSTLEGLVRSRPDVAFGCSTDIVDSVSGMTAAAWVPSSVGAAVARNLNMLYTIALPVPKQCEARKALMDRIGSTYGSDSFEWSSLCSE